MWKFHFVAVGRKIDTLNKLLCQFIFLLFSSATPRGAISLVVSLDWFEGHASWREIGILGHQGGGAKVGEAGRQNETLSLLRV
jgi:hypothetical protein